MTSPAPQRQQLQTRDLWRSVDKLTKDRTQRLVRQLAPGKVQVEKIPIPSLLTQLREALTSSSSGDRDRAGKNTGSRAPLDLAIEALLADMSKQLRAGLAARGHRPRILVAQPRPVGPARAPRIVDEDGYMLVDPDVAGRLTEAAARATVRPDTSRLRHDVPSDLRQVATLVVGTNDQALVDHWSTEYHLWVAHAETILTGDDESIDVRGIRGHACPHCGATYVERIEPSMDPRAVGGYERFRDAALVIAFRDGQVQHVTCRACDTGWWRGDDVDGLGRDIRATTAIMDSAPHREQRREDYGETNAGGRLRGWTDDWWLGRVI